MATNHFDTLYRAREPLFAGYAPEKEVFEHGVPQVVLRLPALVPGGFSVSMTETRYPARSFGAMAVDASARALSAGTGTGPDIGLLLHEVCVELAAGNITLDAPPGAGSFVELKKFAPSEDGRPVRVSLAANRIARLGILESCDNGTTLKAFALYFIRADLALRVANEMAEGMFSVQLA